ncbi:MAG: polysaccharide deacetylase family protein [Bdellovibrio sp.]
MKTSIGRHFKFFSAMVAVNAASAALIGCGNPVSNSVNQAVLDNRQAKTLSDWEKSKSNPEKLFEEWRQRAQKDPGQTQKIGKELCAGLNSLDGQSLSIFENEIRNDANKKLIQNCHEQLIGKLEAYYENERNKLDVGTNGLIVKKTKNNFRFPTNVQYRDISKGYYAVNGDIAKKEIILTLDDGPSALYTRSILQTLSDVNAKAHFFNLGKNIRVNSEIVKLVASEGHAIGSHTNTHACIGTSDACFRQNGRLYSFDEAVDEIKSGHQALYDVLGWADPFFRFPYGETSPQLEQFLRDNSTAEFAWDIDSEDWRAQPIEHYISNIFAQLDIKGRGILIMHDIQRRTAEALPQLLRELYSRGYSIVLLQPSDPAAKRNSKLVKRNLP